MVVAQIESQDIKILLTAIGGILTALTAFMWASFRVVRTALTPNGGKPDSKSLHDKISIVQSDVISLTETVDDRFGRHDRELALLNRRVANLEDYRRPEPV
jgi:hypothetical protein